MSEFCHLIVQTAPVALGGIVEFSGLEYAAIVKYIDNDGLITMMFVCGLYSITRFREDVSDGET
nr:MAG TPA: hypothetical protein [Caudoviricetes sp.]